MEENGLAPFEGESESYMIGVGLKTGSHTRTKITPKLHPLPLHTHTESTPYVFFRSKKKNPKKL